MDTTTLLCQVRHAEAVAALGLALTAAGIPYRAAGLGENATTFFVPVGHLARARAIVDDNLTPEGEGDEPLELAGEAPDEGAPRPNDRRDVEGAAGRPVLAVPFPWRAVEAVLATVMLHTGLLFWAGGALPSGHTLLQYGAALPGAPFDEPWRLISAMFLHASLGQVIGNALALLVFAVPVIGWLGAGRTAALYLTSGVAGGLVSAWLAPAGLPVLGSTGAVAGIGAAWLVLALRRSRGESLGWRARIRSVGVAILVLPVMLGLVGENRAALKSSQVAAALAGMAAGFVLARPAREEPARSFS